MAVGSHNAATTQPLCSSFSSSQLSVTSSEKSDACPLHADPLQHVSPQQYHPNPWRVLVLPHSADLLTCGHYVLAYIFTVHMIAQWHAKP